MAVREPPMYRGRRIDRNHEWVYGPHYEIRGNLVEIWSSVNSVAGVEHYVVDPKTFGQSIGMQDANRVEIFEGDILMFTVFGSYSETFTTEVVYGDWQGMRGFYLRNGRSLFYIGQKNMNIMDDAVIIGNVHCFPGYEGGNTNER